MMRKEIPSCEVEAEVAPGYRPPAIDTGIAILPLSMLSDRDFELLSYLLVKSEIEAEEHKKITKIALMQGVAERGRDCVLYSGDSICGLIQCKKYSGRVTRPQLVKEIVKFLMFSTIDNSLLPNAENFEYKIYVSNDLTEPAIILAHSFGKEILSEITSGQVKKYIEDLSQEYESFSRFREDLPTHNIESLLKSISVSSSNIVDLSARIYRKDSILKTFFNVKPVVSVEDADKLVRKAMDDYGLKYLTDEDLKDLKIRIERTPQSQRINLGIADFYGFDRSFFRFLKAEGFKEIINKIGEIKSSLDLKLMEFLQDEMSNRIHLQITNKLLQTGLIHPFSVGLAAPYIFQRISQKIVSSSLPIDISKKLYPIMNLSKEQLIEEVSRNLFEASERVMNGDYSQLVGDQKIVEFKIQLYSHINRGFSKIDDAKNQLSADLKVLLPVLDQIELELISLLSSTRTVIIKDGLPFSDHAQMKKILESTNAIDWNKK